MECLDSLGYEGKRAVGSCSEHLEDCTSSYQHSATGWLKGELVHCSLENGVCVEGSTLWDYTCPHANEFTRIPWAQLVSPEHLAKLRTTCRNHLSHPNRELAADAALFFGIVVSKTNRSELSRVHGGTIP